MPKTAPYFAALGYATLFGFSFMFTRSALAHIGPFHLLGLRFALAAFLLGALQLMGIIKINLAWADYKKLLPLAFFQPLLYFAAETLCVQLTSSSYAGMMIAIIPIFVTILARIVLNERPRPLQYPFIFVSVGGVLFIMAMQNRTGLEAGGLGSILLLGAVLSAPQHRFPPGFPALLPPGHHLGDDADRGNCLQCRGTVACSRRRRAILGVPGRRVAGGALPGRPVFGGRLFPHQLLPVPINRNPGGGVFQFDHHHLHRRRHSVSARALSLVPRRRRRRPPHRHLGHQLLCRRKVQT